MASGSQACNVMPEKATVSANMRFIPHQGMEESLKIIRKRAARRGITTEVIEGSDFTPPVDIKGEAYRLVADTVRKTFPGCPASPFVLTAATDAVFYQEICDSCIRFAPIVYSAEEKKGIHGVNEALRYDCLPGAVDFYKNLITDNRR
jgi:carboxypeptidase PM20D1